MSILKAVSAKIDIKINERLDDFCSVTHISKQHVIEVAIKNYLDKHEKKANEVDKNGN
jgi:predicted transcriptional regulator